MYPILEGLRVVEASAFVAAPTGGLTLAQLGADVIRVDPIGGGVDAGRWPLAARRERREHLLGEPQVAAITARQWKSLLDAIGGHEAMRHVEAMLGVDLSDEGQRFEARDVIAPVVARWVGARGYDEVRAAFDAAGVCWGPCQSFLEMVSDDPRSSTGNPLFEDVDQPGIGRFMMPGSPLEFRRHEREAVPPRSDARTAHRRDSRRGAGTRRRQDWRAAGSRSRRLIRPRRRGFAGFRELPDGAGRSPRRGSTAVCALRRRR